LLYHIDCYVRSDQHVRGDATNHADKDIHAESPFEAFKLWLTDPMSWIYLPTDGIISVDEENGLVIEYCQGAQDWHGDGSFDSEALEFKGRSCGEFGFEIVVRPWGERPD
jgi:hypothetical protein